MSSTVKFLTHQFPFQFCPIRHPLYVNLEFLHSCQHVQGLANVRVRSATPTDTSLMVGGYIWMLVTLVMHISHAQCIVLLAQRGYNMRFT